MLSQTAEYALRAVLHLARSRDDQPVRVDDVAEALSVPRNYLSKVLHHLAREGVLASTRGPGGGFRLAVPPDRLPLSDVVGGFDPMDEKTTCLLGLDGCSDLNPCAADALWRDVASTVRTFFDETTVQDLLAAEPRP